MAEGTDRKTCDTCTQEFRAFRALKAFGFVTEHSGRTFRITPAGRAWLAAHEKGASDERDDT